MRAERRDLTRLDATRRRGVLLETHSRSPCLHVRYGTFPVLLIDFMNW